MNRQKKVPPVKNLHEVRYKIAEKWAEFESGEMTAAEAKVHVGFASAVLKSFQIEVVNNQVANITKAIDFTIHDGNKLPNGKSINLLDEFTKK